VLNIATREILQPSLDVLHQLTIDAEARSLLI
jgi:hypothetical protein